MPQAVLSHVAMLAEARCDCDAARVPAALRVEVPLRLTAAQVGALLVEFPDCGLQPPGDLVARTRT